MIPLSRILDLTWGKGGPLWLRFIHEEDLTLCSTKTRFGGLWVILKEIQQGDMDNYHIKQGRVTGMKKSGLADN